MDMSPEEERRLMQEWFDSVSYSSDAITVEPVECDDPWIVPGVEQVPPF